MKKVLTIILVLVLTQGYSQNKRENFNETKKIMIQNQLKKGVQRYIYGSETTVNDYAEEDLQASVEIITSILKSYGYKKIADESFNKKIETIFSRIINPQSNNKYLYINYFDKCERTLIYSPNNIDYSGTFIIKSNNFITDFYRIPEILDYQKIYPDLKGYEEKIPTTYKDKEYDEISISLWKDVADLQQQRQKNIDLLVNRNKYLFNDNKASLVWLKFNDQEFLETLVKTFSYVQDKDLLKWVLDRNLNNDEFDKLLFTRTCDNKFVFHKEIFEVMAQADAKSKEKYIQYLLARIDLPKVNDLSFSDATKIKALYCYYATKFMGSIESSSIYSFFPKLQEEKYEDEFRKNNYYNLPDFKELYNDTKYGGIGLPE
jgi:hypothetical protein